MSKKCTQLWREARFQLEMYKAGYGVDMPKRPSTCKKGCLRRHAKKDCSRRHAKKIVSVDMQKKIVSVDMQKNVPVDMQKEIVSVDMQKKFPSTCQRRLSPSTCKKKCSRRHAKHSKCQSYIINLCFSAGIAVSMGEAAKHCSSVAVSMGEAAKLASLLVLWRRRVYGGSCITLVSVSPLASPCL